MSKTFRVTISMPFTEEQIRRFGIVRRESDLGGLARVMFFSHLRDAYGYDDTLEYNLPEGSSIKVEEENVEDD